jgi:hypothetical protein
LVNSGGPEPDDVATKSYHCIFATAKRMNGPVHFRARHEQRVGAVAAAAERA